MTSVNDCHQALMGAKRRLFDALGERQRAKVKLAQLHQRWAGTTTHEDVARQFIATGRTEAASATPKPPSGYPSEYDRMRASTDSHGRSVDQMLGQSARRLPPGGRGVRGSHVKPA
jgi:hypothetical protein